jgi:RimJ/RimL family protein N-acetyltransferase
MLEPSVTIAADRPLSTERMLLRPYVAEDLAGLHAMFRREDVCRYLPWPPMDLGQAQAKLDQRLLQATIGPDRDAIVLAAVETATGRYLGEFMLRLRSPKDRQGEIGWSVHPDFQGRGFATEGAREMLRVGFDELGLHRIYAEADPRNLASLKVMERLGMRREAHLVETWLLKGEWVDEVVCAILESEWRGTDGPVTHDNGISGG